jgi:hypothetical protein
VGPVFNSNVNDSKRKQNKALWQIFDTKAKPTLLFLGFKRSKQSELSLFKNLKGSK